MIELVFNDDIKQRAIRKMKMFRKKYSIMSAQSTAIPGRASFTLGSGLLSSNIMNKGFSNLLF